MILWPVIERELRSASRRRQTYWTRLAAAGAALAICAWAVWDSRFGDQERLGRDTFEAVSFVALLFTLIAGISQTADAISEERREGTLGLLFLTDLRGLHVVAGKFVANSIFAFLSLAAIVPALAIPILLGGVTLDELARMALFLALTLTLSLAVGIFASCLAKDDRITRSVTVAIIVLAFSLRWRGFEMANVFEGWRHVSGQTFLANPRLFWQCAAFQAASALFFLLAAGVLARRFWRDQPRQLAAARTLRSAPSKKKRASRLDRNPMEWLAMRRNILGHITLAIVILAALIMLEKSQARNRAVTEDLALVTTISLHWVVKLAVALVAGNILAQSSREGALEILLTTPLDPKTGLEGMLIGIGRMFGVAIALIIAMDLIFIQFVNFRFPASSSAFKTFLTLRIGVFLLDLVAIAFFSIWASVRTGRAGRASFRAFWAVVLAPLLFTATCLFARVFDSMAWIVTSWIIWDVVLIARTLPDLRRLRERVSEGFRANSAPA